MIVRVGALEHGPLHGYAIANFIQQRSTEVLKVDEGALYPALHRLEVRGLLRSKWGLSENNRRAKFYSLTAGGRRELEHQATAWQRVSAAIARVMKPS